MKSIYRPAHVLEAGVGSFAKGSPRIPGLDEDEATMAVAAGRALFAAAKQDPATIKTLILESRTAAPGWGAVVRLALGATKATVMEGHDAGSGDAALRIVSNAPKPGSTHLEQGGVTAQAEASLADVKGRDGDATGRRTIQVDRGLYERLAKWEHAALAAIPMGAYVSRATWEATAEARYRLLASRCPSCHRGHHPPVDPCPVCGHATETAPLPSRTEAYSYTRIAAGGGPSEFDPFQDTYGSYGVAIADYGEGVRVAAMLTETDLASLRVGLPLESTFRRIYAQEGTWRYGTKFRALDAP